MLSAALQVGSAVSGALIVTAVGHMLVRADKLDRGSSTKHIQQLLYYVTGPCFTFHNLSSTLSLENASVVLLLALANVVICVLGFALAIVPLMLVKADAHTLVYVAGMAAFANVSSLPFYLALTLMPESKVAIYSMETVYSNAQVGLMWGIFYPLSGYYLRRGAAASVQHQPVQMREISLDAAAADDDDDEPAMSLTQTTQQVDKWEVFWRVLNPTSMAMGAALLVAFVAPLKHFFYTTIGFFMTPLLETLGGSNIFLLLLVLGTSLEFSHGTASFPKGSFAIIAAARLVIIPAVVLLVVFIVRPAASKEFMFILFTASETPPNLGLLTVFSRTVPEKRGEISSVFLFLYLACPFTIVFWSCMQLLV